jgi:hypothetical protein
MKFLRRLFGMKPKSEVSSEMDKVIEELADKVEEEEVLSTEEVVEETSEPVGEPYHVVGGPKTKVSVSSSGEVITDSEEETEEVRLTWPQFRSAHKGMIASEISDLWKEYKDGSYEVRNS